MPELKVRIGCVVLAVLMSAVTYYFVEPNLRWGRFGGYKAAGLLSVMVVIGVAGYSVERHDGYTARMNDPDQETIDAINQRLEDDHQRCLKEIPDWDTASHWDMTKCRIQRPAGQNSIALIGDSHAGHLYAGLSAQVKENEGVAVFPAECSIPLIGIQSGGKSWPWNEYLLSEAWKYILSHKNITKVILTHYPVCSWNPGFEPVDKFNPGNHNIESILHDGIIRTYDTLTKAGKEIYVVLDSPLFPHDDWEKCKSSSVMRPVSIPAFLSLRNASVCSVKQSDLAVRDINDSWNKVMLENSSEFKNVHFIKLEQAFCTDGKCSMLDNKGNMLFSDDHHLNIKGSLFAAPFITERSLH